VALFLPWYDKGAASPSGWESLAILDVILAVVGIAAVALVAVTAVQRSAALPIAMESLLSLAGLVVLVLLLFRVADLPGDADGRQAGIWLALASALMVTVGAAIAMRDERPSSEGRKVDVTGRPTPAHPEVEVIPPPSPGE
jgi:hypothetical protein